MQYALARYLCAVPVSSRPPLHILVNVAGGASSKVVSRRLIGVADDALRKPGYSLEK